MDGIPRERAPGEGGDDPHWQELADAVWLAAHWTRTGRTVPVESVVPDGEEPVDTVPPPPAPPPRDRVPPAAAGPGPAAPPGRPEEGQNGPGPGSSMAPLLPGPRPAGAGRGARTARMARALHRLARRVPSRRFHLLDEELTAERSVADGLWMPFLRPAESAAFDLVVLVDDGPTMGIWRGETAALRDAAEHSGAFRSVRTVQVRVPGAGEAAAPTLRWSAGARSSVELGEVLDGGRGRVFLVVTDGLGHGWAARGADALLHRLGRTGPTALVHLLPPHMRHRSSLYPHHVLLEAGGFGAANGALGFQGRDPLRPLPEDDGEGLAVPVVSLRAGSLAAWADLVVGERGVRRELPAVLTGSLNAGRPAPGLRAPAPPQTAASAVRHFFGQATPAARRLATHLAAAPFDFDLVAQLRNRTMPDTGAEHLAEILMGGLIDWGGDADDRLPDFADGVREALLATTTRVQLATVVSALGELPGAGERGVALRAALRDPLGIALPDPGAPQWLRAELAVMRALAGPYAQRARMIEGAGAAVARHASISGPVPGASYRSDPGTVPAPMARAEATAAALDAPPADADAYADKRSAAPAVLVDVPPRNGAFVGRTGLLRTLRERLAERDLVCVLPDPSHASGGVGKSELALEYVYRHQDDHDLVCWIPAGNTSLVLAALASLAEPLGLGGPSDGDARAVDRAVPAVLDALRTGVPYDRWLLVLDDAGDVEALRRHLPEYGPGKFIVTSRDRDWEQVASAVEVGPFARQEAVELLGRLAPALPAAEADRMTDIVGDVPLAVRLVGAWYRSAGPPVSEYLERLDHHAYADGPSAPDSLAPALDLTLRRLGDESPRARHLLDVCASLGPEPIPRALLAHVPTGDGARAEGEPAGPVEVSRALRTLSLLALVTVDHRAGTVRLDRQLRTALLDTMPPEQRERARASAHRLLVAARPGSPSSPAAWPAHWSLLPHVLGSGAVAGTDPELRALVHDTVLFLDHCGDRETALALAGEARAAWLTLSGEENGDVLRMSRTYALLLRRAGRLAESVPLAESTLEVARRKAADAEEMIESLCQLADTRRHQGRFEEARALGEEAAGLATHALGDEAPLTLRAVHGLGVGLRLAGRFEEALALDRRNARLAGLALGPLGHLTLESAGAVSAGMRETGDYPGARAAQEDLYRMARAGLGEQHGDTLRVATGLAACRRRDGAFREAAGLSEETLYHCTARYGADHLDTLAAAVGAVVDRRLADDAEWSWQLGGTTVERLAARLGADHLCTLVARANLAATLRALGLVDEARDVEDDVALRMEATAGPRHPTALTVTLGRANTAYARLDFERARHLDEAALPVLHESMGARHPLSLVCAANLSLDLRVLSRGAEADALWRTAVEGLAVTVGDGHPWLTAVRQRRRIECEPAYVPF
ncbi:FxSxx-COOH system tetratricopeptide repeat protein [Streptomyces sp. NPDC008313]|uniref:FxSxx-COOH system tetratricopeptide repeat protein n=1 Tax=Streptomyces sp. NPDC008313 TaxID=3364826 RepID=UPI0036E4330E